MNFLHAVVRTASFLIKQMSLCYVLLLWYMKGKIFIFGHVDLLSPYKQHNTIGGYSIS